MADIGHGATDEPPLDRTNSESVVERTCKYLSALALMVMLVVIGIDIVTRWAFNFSYEVSDEVAAYMLVAIAFLSLPVSHINGAFHRVEFVQARLSMRWKLISSLFFELVALVFCAIFVWQFVNLVRSTWRFGDHAPTFLETPLWLPRSLLVIGMAALCISLVRSMAADVGRLLALGSTDRARNGS
ncbi:MAG TPA: TRAP transporter small permease [Hyphomicrobiaceae bacterium]|nr:TRAP transporter small permease [Hyphomicrobiaceae bacterium]